MVTPENNNKYYRMIPHGDIFTVEFGRVGGGCQTASYPISQWDKKYNEKVKKGYTDQTALMQDLIAVEAQEKKEYKDIDDPSIRSIVSRL